MSAASWANTFVSFWSFRNRPPMTVSFKVVSGPSRSAKGAVYVATAMMVTALRAITALVTINTSAPSLAAIAATAPAASVPTTRTSFSMTLSAICSIPTLYLLRPASLVGFLSL